MKHVLRDFNKELKMLDLIVDDFVLVLKFDNGYEVTVYHSVTFDKYDITVIQRNKSYVDTTKDTKELHKILTSIKERGC